jgi:hypothetical protein
LPKAKAPSIKFAPVVSSQRWAWIGGDGRTDSSHVSVAHGVEVKGEARLPLMAHPQMVEALAPDLERIAGLATGLLVGVSNVDVAHQPDPRFGDVGVESVWIVPVRRLGFAVGFQSMTEVAA